MPIVNAGGVYIDNVKVLPDSPINQEIPFSFEGKNMGPSAVVIMPKPACGCTTVSKEFVVEPNATFSVDGVLQPRKSAINYSKTVTLHIAENKEPIKYTNTLTLTFSGKVYE